MPGALSAGTVSLGVKPDSAGFGKKLAEGIMGESGVLGKVGEELGLKLTAGIGIAAAAVGGISIKMASDMQVADAKIQGNAQVTAKQAQAIGDAFLNTAGKSTFSGQEMAKAFGPVAGVIQMISGHTLTAADSMKVMSASTALAEATSLPLASTTSDLAAVMQSFGLRTKDAAETGNTLFNTSRLTNVGLDALASTVDRLHGRLGIAAPSLADTSGLMVDLASHGISGSRGVMVVQTALQTLLGGSKPTNAELKSLGVNVFDASGKFVGMQSVLTQLTPKLNGMSDSQRTAAETAIFGRSAAIAMNSTILAGAKGLGDATAKVVAHDAAEKAAAATAGTLHGQIETLKSGFSDVMTMLGEKLIPILIGTATWFKNNAVLVLSVAGAFVAWKVITLTVTAVNTAIAISRGLMIGVTAASYGAEGATYAVGNAQKVGYTIAAIFNGTMWKQVAALIASKAETVALVAMYTGDFFVAVGKNIAGTIASTAAWIANTAAQIGAKAAIIAGVIAMGAATAAQWLWNAAMNANPIGLVVVAIAGLVAAIIWVATQTTVFQDIWRVVSKFFVDTWNDISSSFRTIWTSIVSWFSGAVDAVIGFVKVHWGLILSFFIGPLGLAIQWIVEHWTGIVAFFQTSVNRIGGFFGAVFGGIGGIIRGAFNGVVSFVKGIFNDIIGVVNGIIDGVNTATGLAGAIGIHIGKIPHLPRLEKGGTVIQPGSVLVGEKGPEVLNLPRGASVVPLSKSEGRGMTLVYNAAPNQSFDAEQDLWTAMERRKVLV